MQALKLPPQEPIAFDPKVAIFGAWRLGFQWLYVTLGGSRPVLGLGLYIRHRDRDESRTYLTFSLKEAVAFAERCDLPPRRFAELMHYALWNAKAKKEDLEPWF